MDVNISSGSTALIFHAPAVITGNGRLTISSGSCGITTDSELTIKNAEIIVDSGLGVVGSGDSAVLKIIKSELTVSAPFSEASVTGFAEVTLEGCGIVSPAGAYFSGGIPVAKEADPENPEAEKEVPVNELTILPVLTPIDAAELTITEPEALCDADTAVSADVEELGCSLEWSCGEVKLAEGEKFKANTEYTAVIKLIPAEGYRLTRNTRVTVLGQPAERTAAYEDGTAEYSISFKVPYKLLLGDVNGDGAVNMLDLVDLQRSINGWPIDICEENADVHGDGAINMLDLTELERQINSMGTN